MSYSRNSPMIETGMEIRTKATIIVPGSIVRVMLGALPLLPDPGLEYGLYLKGEWDQETLTLRVTPDEFYIPAQEVSAASIKFTEDPPDASWNVVIHRHPRGVRSFSGVDDSSINREFLASILYLPMFDFPMGVVNVPVADGLKLQLRADVEMEGPLFPDLDGMEDVIERKVRRFHTPVSHAAWKAPGAAGQQQFGATGALPPLTPVGATQQVAGGGEIVKLPPATGGGASTPTSLPPRASTGGEPYPLASRVLKRLGRGGRRGANGTAHLDEREEQLDRAVAAAAAEDAAVRDGLIRDGFISPAAGGLARGVISGPRGFLSEELPLGSPMDEIFAV